MKKLIRSEHECYQEPRFEVLDMLCEQGFAVTSGTDLDYTENPDYNEFA